MTRTIRALNKGRLAVWWVTHRQDAIRASQLTTLIVLILLAGRFDYEDQLDAERAKTAKAVSQLAEVAGRYGPPIPPVVFVLEARTPRELELRLADVVNAAERTRYGYFLERAPR